MLPINRKRIRGFSDGGDLGSVLTILLLLAAIVANVTTKGLLIHTWLDWPAWAQVLSFLAAAGTFCVLNGAVFGLGFFAIFTAAIFFMRGPEPVQTDLEPTEVRSHPASAPPHAADTP